jgi:hypothetical protein
MLRWNKRPVPRKTETAVIHRWKCKDAPIVVDRITSILGLPQRILLVRVHENREELLGSGFRKVATAQKAAEEYA